MFVLGEGCYAGKVAHRRNFNGCVLSTTSYSRDDFVAERHSHEHLQISFVFEGGGNVSTLNNQQNNSQDVFFYHAGESHCWAPRAPFAKSVNLEISPRFLSSFDVTENQISRACTNKLSVKFLMLKMLNEVLHHQAESSDNIRILLLELVSDSHTTSASSQLPKWIVAIRELLSDSWDQWVSLADLSSATGVHPVTISKFFRKYFSCTLGEYQRKLKVERSIPLIKNSNQTLTQIAIQCGFADQSHFTRTFKQVTGLKPNAFRRI